MYLLYLMQVQKVRKAQDELQGLGVLTNVVSIG